MQKLILLLISLLFCSHREIEVNDSLAIQALIDNNSIIELPAGKWNITKHLVLKEGKTLRGTPGTVLFHESNPRYAAILVVQSNTVIENITFRSINDQKYWYIPGLSTLCSNVTHLVIEAGAKNVTIRNCRFVGAEYGITNSRSPNSELDNIVIDNVTIDSCFMSMLLTGVDRAFITNYRSDKSHIKEQDQRIGHHAYFEGVRHLFINNFHARGGCCDALKLRNTVLENMTNHISNVTIDSTGAFKIDKAGDVNVSNITFTGNTETLWPTGFKTLQISNMIVNAIDSPTASTRIVTAGGNALPQGEIMRINGLTTYGTVSMELTKIKRTFLNNVTMFNPLGDSYKIVPIKMPFLPQDQKATGQSLTIDNLYVIQTKKHRQSQFIEVQPLGNANIKIKNSEIDFTGNNVGVFMKADSSSKLSFSGVEYKGVGFTTWYDKGEKAVFNSEQ